MDVEQNCKHTFSTEDTITEQEPPTMKVEPIIDTDIEPAEQNTWEDSELESVHADKAKEQEEIPDGEETIAVGVGAAPDNMLK